MSVGSTSWESSTGGWLDLARAFKTLHLLGDETSDRKDAIRFRFSGPQGRSSGHKVAGLFSVLHKAEEPGGVVASKSSWLGLATQFETM